MMNTQYSSMVEKLRDQLGDLIPSSITDFDLLRWVKEFEGDFDSIVPNLRHHLRFINSHDFSKRSDNYAVMEKYWPFGLLGPSGKDDNIVYVENLGILDGYGIRRSMPRSAMYFERFHKSETVVMKAIRKYEEENGRQSGLLVIADLDGLRLNMDTIARLNGPYNSLINVLLKHYKDLAKKCILINTPPVMNVLWKIIRAILPTKIKQCLIVLGSDWKTEILKHVDANALPVYLGGHLVDENKDPKCQSKIVFPSVVPEQLYWEPSADDATQDEFASLIVSPGTYEYVTIEVKESGSVLKWSYYTDRDWGFGVFYSKDNEETSPEAMDMVFPQLLHISGRTVVVEKDNIECKRSGFYKLWFNNSFSYVRKLTVHYKIVLESI